MNLRLAETAAAAPAPLQPASIIGLAAIARLAFSGSPELQSLWQSLMKRTMTDPDDVGGLLDLSVIELIAGRRDSRLKIQAQALAKQRVYRLEPAVPSAQPLRLLAFVVPGDFMVNTPVEFLLEGSGVQLDLLYLVPGGPLPAFIPEHDVAFIAIAESEANRPLLQAMREIAKIWPVPVVNAPHFIERLSRDGACAMLQNLAGVYMPANIRTERAKLEEVADSARPLAGLLGGAAFPIIVRPLGSHGGQGLEKIASAAELKAYLARQQASAFYVSPFVDYCGDDGLYRKCRIALIDGRAYGCHLAISPNWMVHYLNADMADNAANRAEEDRFLTRFDAEFGRRHQGAFAAIAERIELDYAQIDCAETRDGRLLIFEIGTAMIVHAMDPADVFPYKKAAMDKVFAAFVAMLNRNAASGR
jgi:glutathione synthase/RimK-type ligase-like ATP-grasp enzyme